MKTLVRNIYLLTIIVLLVACSKEKKHEDLIKYVSDLNKKAVTPIEPLPVFKPYSFPRYDADKGHSPFTPTKADSSFNNQKFVNALQEHPLKSLIMVGTLSDHGTIWALIKTPSGRVYQTSIGQIIGVLKGRVVKIDSNCVVVEEVVCSKKNSTCAKRSKTLVLNSAKSVTGNIE